jgi:hypothetical protein
MDEQATTDLVHFAAPGQKTAGDLSQEIERAVPREPLDRVRCVHLYDNHYRCNWWAPGAVDVRTPMAEWAMLAMHRVRRSQFITATIERGELVMKQAEPSVG